MLILNETDLRLVLEMSQVVRVVEEGFRMMALGLMRSPERLNMALPELEGALLEMPAALISPPGVLRESDGPASALGTKIVSVFNNNPARGLDTVQSIYVLLDAATGAPLAILDGKFITAIRTAATSAVATRFMAREDATVLGIFGAGVQARFHIDAIISVRNIKRVIVTSRTESKAKQLAAEVAESFGIATGVSKSPAEVPASSDIICTCTTSGGPLFESASVGAGTHINAAGAFTPGTREIDSKTISRAWVIIDAHQSAGVEAGEILIPISEGIITNSHVKGTLSDLVMGSVRGRNSQDEVTVFKSCGLAIEDLVTATLAYRNALAAGVGAQVAI